MRDWGGIGGRSELLYNGMVMEIEGLRVELGSYVH